MIEIKNINFKYRKNRSLFVGLSLNMFPGNIYGLLGKNGAGKTTLLRLMTGLLHPQKGTCMMKGINLSERSPSVLEKIYFLPEEYSLPSVSLKKFVRVNSAFYKKFSTEQLNKYIDEFDIDPYQKLSSMSYGQKKKFLMSFGLATNATFMVMDEPTNGLDIPSKSQFRKIMASTISEERCYIISTHQVRDLENLIDPVVVIDKGRIVFEQSIEQITNKLIFGTINDYPEKEVLYAEGMEGRQKGLMVNKTNGNSNVDMELLFNAIIFENEKIINLFN